MKEVKQMKTELQVSVIYLKDDANDINEFDFFIRMFPVEDKKCISVSAMPRFSVNDKTVKHIKFSFNTEKDLNAYDVMRIIAQLKELEWIVCDKDLTAKDAQTHLMEMMKKQIENYSKD